MTDGRKWLYDQRGRQNDVYSHINKQQFVFFYLHLIWCRWWCGGDLTYSEVMWSYISVCFNGVKTVFKGEKKKKLTSCLRKTKNVSRSNIGFYGWENKRVSTTETKSASKENATKIHTVFHEEGIYDQRCPKKQQHIFQNIYPRLWKPPSFLLWEIRSFIRDAVICQSENNIGYFTCKTCLWFCSSARERPWSNRSDQICF